MLQVARKKFFQYLFGEKKEEETLFFVPKGSRTIEGENWRGRKKVFIEDQSEFRTCAKNLNSRQVI